jgi:hypothetical protein
MMAFSGGVERTLSQLAFLLDQSGWKLTRVHHGSLFASSSQKVIAVPV